jgi:Undecaprenyl-phosphate glucose phosphotransferase
MAKIADETFRGVPPRSLTGTRKSISHEVVCGGVKIFDFVSVVAAGQLAFLIYEFAILGTRNNYDRYTYVSILTALAFVVALRRSGGYSVKQLVWTRWQVSHGFLLLVEIFAVLASLAFLTKLATFYSRGWALAWAGLCFAEFAGSRLALRYLIRRWTRVGYLARVIAVIGAGEIGERVVAKFDALGDGQVLLAGIFDDRLTRTPDAVGGHPIMGTTDDLIKIAQTAAIDEIVIALPFSAAQRIGVIVAKLRSLPIDVRVCIDPIADSFPIQRIGETGSVRVVEIIDRPLKHWSGVAKAIEDKVLGALFLLIALPLLALIAIAIRLDSEGPVLFAQERFGLASKPIRVFKFRTMRIEAGDPRGAARTVPDDPRVTRVGRFLRAWSLDELPQLFNVMRGEMSLVGPRPHAVAMRVGERLYHDAVAEYLRRHRVKPGITGWAQVNGLRGEIDTIDKARSRVTYDLRYIENWSLSFDLEILLRTVWAVVSRQEAY